VRRRWREWERIGASGQVLSWIRHGVRVKFKHGDLDPTVTKDSKQIQSTTKVLLTLIQGMDR
jgi:hypothetical protein